MLARDREREREREKLVNERDGEGGIQTLCQYQIICSIPAHPTPLTILLYLIPLTTKKKAPCFLGRPLWVLERQYILDLRIHK